MKHTGNAWNVGAHGDVFADDGLHVATVTKDCFEAPQNARLIAEAPAMFALLSKLNTAFYAGSPKELRAVFTETKPLLRKVRGEAP